MWDDINLYVDVSPSVCKPARYFFPLQGIEEAMPRKISTFNDRV